MTVPVIIALVFIAAWPYLRLHARWPRRFPLPGIGRVLERLPAPRWPRLGGILDGLTIPLRYARRPAGEHAKPLRVDLAVTATLPRLKTTDRPPWTTQPQPALTEETSR